MLDFGSAFFTGRDRPAAGSTAASPEIRRILALLPEPETVGSCLDCARAIAASEPEATIEAVHLGFDPERAVASAEEIGIQLLRERWEGTAAARAARTRAAFDDWLGRHPEAAVVWRDGAGEADAAAAAETAKADLLVIGRPVHLDARDALHRALFHTRRPVLVAPPRASDDGRTIGRHLVVGWKPGEPAARAVAAFSGRLKRAEKVSVVCIAKEGGPPYAPSAAEFFGRLGIVCEILTRRREGRSVGVQILAEVDRLGGDGLVIGAYRHGPLWEAILGGVTRDVLREMTVPVFMMR